MKLLKIGLILLIAAIDADRYACNITAHESANCTSQQLGRNRLVTVWYFDIPCSDGYDGIPFISCCVDIEALPNATTVSVNATRALFSCSSDEGDEPESSMPDLSGLSMAMRIFISLMILFPVACCLCICYWELNRWCTRQQ